ncbi:MAG TPA: hypothetical protein VF134_05155 [Candidatus Dormibacteraeota bacterium]
MSLYGIIADLRREHPTPAASKTLDLVVAELGRTRDNLQEAVARLEEQPLPTGGKPILEEVLQRARAEGVDDLDRPPAPDEAPPLEPLDEPQIGIAALLGGSALIVVLLALVAVAVAIHQAVSG